MAFWRACKFGSTSSGGTSWSGGTGSRSPEACGRTRHFGVPVSRHITSGKYVMSCHVILAMYFTSYVSLVEKCTSCDVYDVMYVIYVSDICDVL